MGWHPVQPWQGLCMGAAGGLETCRTTRTELERTVSLDLMLV